MPGPDAHPAIALPADISRDQDGTWHVRLPPGHPFFEGHFPDEPILPGIAHVELALALLSKEASGSMTLASIADARFLRPILPNEDIAVRLVASGANAWRFDLRVDGVPASRGELRMTAPA